MAAGLEGVDESKILPSLLHVVSVSWGDCRYSGAHGFASQLVAIIFRYVPQQTIRCIRGIPGSILYW